VFYSNLERESPIKYYFSNKFYAGKMTNEIDNQKNILAIQKPVEILFRPRTVHSCQKIPSHEPVPLIYVVGRPMHVYSPLNFSLHLQLVNDDLRRDLHLDCTCSLMVGNSLSSASLPPRLFMKAKVMPCTLARARIAARMYASLVVSLSTCGYYYYYCYYYYYYYY
jgi:hypothetical protein